VSDDDVLDYGRLHRGDGRHSRVDVATLDEVQAVLEEANRLRTPVRLRGAGHSMNGSAVPRRDEILVSSSRLRRFRFDHDRTVTVGAGAAVWDVDRMLRSHGFQLLLCNDGGAAAATVGGFVAAGGIGVDTWRHGGFWETAEEVVLVTGSGEVVRSSPGDDLFPWIFGSMGQLGVIVEVTLRIRACDDAPQAVYPVGVQGDVAPSAADWESNVWFTLFVPEGAADRAARQLEELATRHRAAWQPRGGYGYFVRFHSFNPPLLYPAQASFVAVGVWGMTPPAVDDLDVVGLQGLERDIAGLVASEPAYRRYIQAELTFGPFDFAAYFGEHVFNAFRAHKLACDPKLLLGRGSVFP